MIKRWNPPARRTSCWSFFLLCGDRSLVVAAVCNQPSSTQCLVGDIESMKSHYNGACSIGEPPPLCAISAKTGFPFLPPLENHHPRPVLPARLTKFDARGAGGPRGAARADGPALSAAGVGPRGGGAALHRLPPAAGPRLLGSLRRETRRQPWGLGVCRETRVPSLRFFSF